MDFRRPSVATRATLGSPSELPTQRYWIGRVLCRLLKYLPPMDFGSPSVATRVTLWTSSELPTSRYQGRTCISANEARFADYVLLMVLCGTLEISAER